VVTLDYGYGFEEYGAYEGWASGWDVIVNGKNLGSTSSLEKTRNLPKSLLLAEYKLGMSIPEVSKPLLLTRSGISSECYRRYQNTR